MKTLTLEEITSVLMDMFCDRFQFHRRPKGPDDWGDAGTVKLHLKRHGAGINSPWDHFGFYCGLHDIGYVVAVKGVATNHPVSGEVFDTMEEMKARWRLD